MPSLRSVAAVRTAPSRGYDARILDPLRTDTSVLDGTQPGSATTARLLVEETGRPPRVVVVPIGAEVRVGRSATVEVSLDDTRVSREHAVIRFDGRSVLVRANTAKRLDSADRLRLE